MCQCYDGFQGRNCSEPIGENLHSPVLNSTEFNVEITENYKPGSLLLKAAAYDEDTGLNGDIQFLLDLSGAGIDLASYIVIDNVEGSVTLVKAIPRSLVPTGQVGFILVVSDKGFPPKTAEATVNITIIDINDHCPKFIYPANEAEIFINSSTVKNTTLMTFAAEDEDYGLNSKVLYQLTGPVFQMDTHIVLGINGRLYIGVSPLPVGRHALSVIATDQADTPCSSQLMFYVNVYPNDIAPIIPTTTTTTTKPTTILTTNLIQTTRGVLLQESSTTAHITYPITRASHITDTTSSIPEDTRTENPPVTDITTTIPPINLPTTSILYTTDTIVSTSEAQEAQTSKSATQKTNTEESTVTQPSMTIQEQFPTTTEGDSISILAQKGDSPMIPVAYGIVIGAVIFIAVIITIILGGSLYQSMGTIKKLESDQSSARPVHVPGRPTPTSLNTYQ